MNITFTPLTESHFPLLLKWLEAPHVKTWWDQTVQWTPELIREKYTDYVKGCRLENGIAKMIKAYIICVNKVPIGYIQVYNAYDFARSKPLTGLPSSLAAFDVLIGEKAYLKQGIGSEAIAQFLKEYGTSYTHVFADPKNTNLAAIRAYEKAGFKKINRLSDEVWMVLEQPFMNIHFEKANISHMDIKIKMLTKEDWKTWKPFRLEALENSPENFGSSYEEELDWPDSNFKNALTKSDIFGVFIDSSLVSCAGFYSLQPDKTKHRGVIWGMYTRPEYRGQGIASALVQTIINHAKSCVTQLHLACVTTNLGAIKLYKKKGFEIYGTEPNALKIGDTFFDEYLMILDLTGESVKELDTYLRLST